MRFVESARPPTLIGEISTSVGPIREFTRPCVSWASNQEPERRGEYDEPQPVFNSRRPEAPPPVRSLHPRTGSIASRSPARSAGSPADASRRSGRSLFRHRQCPYSSQTRHTSPTEMDRFMGFPSPETRAGDSSQAFPSSVNLSRRPRQCHGQFNYLGEWESLETSTKWGRPHVSRCRARRPHEEFTRCEQGHND